MNTLIRITCHAVAILIACCLSAYAASEPWTQKDVNEVVEKVKSGKSVYLQKALPADQTQVIDISVNTNMGQAILYRIDLRAKQCFVYRDTLVPVPCKAIKDGYPLFAPIIDWEK